SRAKGLWPNPNGRPKGSKNKDHGVKILSRPDEKAKWLACLALAEEKKDLSAMIRIMTQISEMQNGRPYVAPTPAQRGNNIDPRLSTAVKELLKPQSVVAESPESRENTLPHHKM